MVQKNASKVNIPVPEKTDSAPAPYMHISGRDGSPTKAQILSKDHYLLDSGYDIEPQMSMQSATRHDISRPHQKMSNAQFEIFLFLKVRAWGGGQ